MNHTDMYKIIWNRIESDISLGGRKCGRKTGDEVYDYFLRQTRIAKDAVKTFSPVDRKLWEKRVAIVNEDLIAHAVRISRSLRALSWKKTCAGRVPNFQIQQAAEKLKRLKAVKEIIAGLDLMGVKVTTKKVSLKLEAGYKHLSPVKLDTLRKELSQIRKAAHQSVE